MCRYPCTAYWLYCGLSLRVASAANFLSHVVKLGVNRPRATRGSAGVRFTMRYKTAEAACQEERIKKFFNERKERREAVRRGTRNLTRKVFSVQGLSRLCSPIRVGRLSRTPAGYSTDSEQRASWIRNPWMRDTPPMWAKWLSHRRD